MKHIKDIHSGNEVQSISKIDCHFNDIEASKVKKVKLALKEKSLYNLEFGELSFLIDDYQVQ